MTGIASLPAADAPARELPRRFRFREWWHGLVARRDSLQTRLLLAFLLVGPLPMFFAAELVGRVVGHAFERNLTTWLHETAAYFVGSIADAEQETGAVAQVLIHDSDALGDLVDGTAQLPPLTARMLEAEGYDFFAVLDDQGEVVYSARPIRHYSRLRLGPGVTLYDVDDGTQRKTMASAEAAFQHRGRQYRLLLGTPLDEEAFGRVSAVSSFDLRVYSISPTRELFHLREHDAARAPPPDWVIAAMSKPGAGDHAVFQRHASGTGQTSLYLPVRDDLGRLDGVVFCALRTQRWDSWVSHTSIFLIVFITGTLLSLTVGFAVARRVSDPLRRLDAGVRAITAGQYRQRIEARGHDEVSALASAFNRMAERLENLHEMEAALRRRDRLSALGLAAAGIAHEVRNPLGIIRTSAELVRNRLAVAADRRLLSNVIDEVRRIDHLITEFLAFVRPGPLERLPVRTGDVIERVARFCDPELGRRGVALRRSGAALDARIVGDEDALYQAALNVVLNAMDAMPQGGTLDITGAIEGDHVRIRFVDSGPGIADQLLERVFDPFVTTKARGTGLGLAKVAAVMEGHGGRAEARNVEGGGASFEFVLPLVS